MKKLIIICLLLTSCAAIEPSKNKQTIVDKFGRTQAYIEEDGTITDKFGRTKGYILPDGTITDQFGRKELEILD